MPVKVFVTDLDNTLYNWVDYFAPAFRAMVLELQNQTDQLFDLGELPRRYSFDDLCESFKEVYKRHGTIEYAFAIEELAIWDGVIDVSRSAEFGPIIRPAVEAFRGIRKETLRLYPGVKETLSKLREAGVKLVAHSDAMLFYVRQRLLLLEIADLFEAMYAQRDHDISPKAVGTTAYQGFRIPAEHYLNREESKPSPAAILKIMADFGVAGEETVYVGDSLTKDVRMAQKAGVIDVWASYGKDFKRENWDLLVKVTPWTPSKVSQAESESDSLIRPSYSISTFSEVVEPVFTSVAF